MSQVVTFTDKDGLFTFTVKEEFLTKCSNPSERDIEDLTTNFEFRKFLHNTTGPAVKYNIERFPKEVIEKLNLIPESKNAEAYWLEGELLTGEQREKFIHDLKFNDNFETLLSKEEAS